MTIGRAEAVAKDVLAPKAVGNVLKALTSDKPLPFSIETDAPNKGNRKMFPLAVQYLSPECGVTNKMLDFMENADESAAGIVALIKQSLENLAWHLFNWQHLVPTIQICLHQLEEETKRSAARKLPCPHCAQHNEACSWSAHCGCGKCCAEDLWLLFHICQTKRIPQRIL